MFVQFFFYYCKAFDSVPHKTLLNKLSQLGLHENIVHWVASYLHPGIRMLLSMEPSLTVYSCTFWRPSGLGAGSTPFSHLC